MASRLKHVSDLKQVNELLNLEYSSKTDIQLSQAGQRALDGLALFAESLGMGATDVSNYYTAISKLSMDQMDMQNELNILEDIEYKLEECQSQANDELDSMKRILANLKNNSSGNDSKLHQDGTDQVFKKGSEYLALENKYNEMGIEKQGSRLSDIHELENKVMTIEKQYKKQYEILETYQGLPPDMALASFKIRKTKDQLHELEQERENLITDIAKSVH